MNQQFQKILKIYLNQIDHLYLKFQYYLKNLKFLKIYLKRIHRLYLKYPMYQLLLKNHLIYPILKYPQCHL
jgi:hypothetical protein